MAWEVVVYLSKTHIHLCVDDAGESAAFYEALLGAPPARQSSISAVFDFDSPPLVLTVEAQEEGKRASKRGQRDKRGGRKNGRFALVVTQPQHVGAAAIALRRAGVQLRLEDQAIGAEDPDGNAWEVRYVESAAGRSVEEVPETDVEDRRRP
jgi:catechol 2,3-dioxygenase-like lactoylglutathione lyase family enzyme